MIIDIIAFIYWILNLVIVWNQGGFLWILFNFFFPVEGIHILYEIATK